MPTDAELLKDLNSAAPPANTAVGGTIVSLSQAEGTSVLEFRPTPDVVNAAGFIAAGYITQMLDTACAVAGIAGSGQVATTLEIKTNCLCAARPGLFRAEARVRKLGRSIAFIEAELRDAEGVLVATASTTTNLVDMDKLQEKSGLK